MIAIEDDVVHESRPRLPGRIQLNHALDGEIHSQLAGADAEDQQGHAAQRPGHELAVDAEAPIPAHRIAGQQGHCE